MIKLPESLTTVTPLSKTLAMILFVLLPFIGFYFGTLYQKSVTPAEITNSQQTILEKTNDNYIMSPTHSPSPSLSIPSSLTDTELYDMVDKFVGNKISRSGGSVYYAGTEKVGDDLYTVTVGVDKSEGSTYFIGKDKGVWKVSSYLDNLWCPWLEISKIDDSVKPYLGIEECRK